MNHLSYIRSEARLIKAVADNKNKKSELRQSWSGKYDLYQEVMKMLKTTPPDMVVKVLEEMEKELQNVVDPDWETIGRRTACHSLLKILREE